MERDEIDPGCTCILYDENKRVLLHLRDRKEGILNPGAWDLFGGSVEGDESAEEGIIREVKEELGVNLDNFEHFRVNDYRPYGEKVVDDIFIKEVDSSITEKFSLNEGRGFAWFHFDEIASLNLGYHQEMFEKMFKELEVHLSKNGRANN